MDPKLVIDPCLKKTDFFKKVRKDNSAPNKRLCKLFHWKSDKINQAVNITKKDDSFKFIYRNSDANIVCKIYPFCFTVGV